MKYSFGVMNVLGSLMVMARQAKMYFHCMPVLVLAVIRDCTIYRCSSAVVKKEKEHFSCPKRLPIRNKGNSP